MLQLRHDNVLAMSLGCVQSEWGDELFTGDWEVTKAWSADLTYTHTYTPTHRQRSPGAFMRLNSSTERLPELYPWWHISIWQRALPVCGIQIKTEHNVDNWSEDLWHLCFGQNIESVLTGQALMESNAPNEIAPLWTSIHLNEFNFRLLWYMSQQNNTECIPVILCLPQSDAHTKRSKRIKENKGDNLNYV